LGPKSITTSEMLGKLVKEKDRIRRKLNGDSSQEGKEKGGGKQWGGKAGIRGQKPE